MTAATLYRTLAVILFAVAGAILFVAYVMICVRIGSSWPWGLVVHEDGKRTLLLTILYFEHAVRELPLDLLLGVAIGGCAIFAVQPATRPIDRPNGSRRIVAWAWLSAIVVVIIIAGTAVEGGRPMVLDNLLQNHTRPGAALVWGSHWRYHLLERVALILISIGFAGLLRLFADGGRGHNGRYGLVVAACSLAIYLLLTITFTNGWRSLLDPILDPLYLGHQARELFTHALVTFPVGWAACLLLLPKVPMAAPAHSLSWPKSASKLVIVAIIAGILGLTIGSYVCLAALRSDSVSYGQTTDLAMLIFPHFFEHSFTYLVVPFVAALVYEIIASRTKVAAIAAGGFMREPGDRA